MIPGSDPDPDVSRVSNDYSKRHGLYVPSGGFSHVVMPREVSNRVGRAYEALPDMDKGALPAFKALREEVGHQYDAMTRPRSKGGLGLNVEPTAEEPYGADDPNKVFREMGNDVRNGRIKVLKTSSTGGHPYFSDDDNDMFRAVHDVFGHLGSGRGVDMHGEEAAYRKHSTMFSPLARQALATETRGQNSFLHLRGHFPPQKVAILGEADRGGYNVGPQLRNLQHEAWQENRKQGIR